MSDVFISYSRKDIAFARLLKESLKKSQVDAWIDWERIPVGEKWWPEIRRSHRKSQYLHVHHQQRLDRLTGLQR